MKFYRPAHAPEFIAVIRTLEPLLRQYAPYARLEFDDLCDGLAWYWNKGTLAYVINCLGAPEAICIIKLFRRLEQFLDPFVHEPCRKFCQIEMMVAQTPNAMGQICEELTQRWGPQAIILWDRGTRTEDGAPRMYNWAQFQKLARRITYGVVETA